MNDFAHEPVALVRKQRFVNGKDARDIALGADDDSSDQGLLDPQTKQRGVELPKCAQGPELIARRQNLLGGCWLIGLRTSNGQRGDSPRPV
jgi:hypothetical protein